MAKHLEKKKKRNTKKQMILLFIVILLIIIITGILIKIRNRNKLEIEVAQIINNAFESLRKGNIEESRKYLNYDSLIDILDEEILNEENLLKYELNAELFKELEWKIEKINIQENDIKVTMKIKNKDYSEIIMKWLELIIKEEENGNKLTDEQCAGKIKEAILNDQIKTATETRKITLKNKNEELQIIVNEELGNGLFPKIEKLDEALTEIE